jgi:hypothetical protein
MEPSGRAAGIASARCGRVVDGSQSLRTAEKWLPNPVQHSWLCDLMVGESRYASVIRVRADLTQKTA